MCLDVRVRSNGCGKNDHEDHIYIQCFKATEVSLFSMHDPICFPLLMHHLGLFSSYLKGLYEQLNAEPRKSSVDLL